MCCSVLRHVAVCCSVLQCVLQCVLLKTKSRQKRDNLRREKVYKTKRRGFWLQCVLQCVVVCSTEDRRSTEERISTERREEMRRSP